MVNSKCKWPAHVNKYFGLKNIVKTAVSSSTKQGTDVHVHLYASTYCTAVLVLVVLIPNSF